MSNGKWVQGYYFAEPFTHITFQGEDISSEYEAILLPERQEVQIMGNTICRYVRDTKYDTLWENDVFWVCSSNGILGCIEWGEDYDGWIVNEYPNVVEGDRRPRERGHSAFRPKTSPSADFSVGPVRLGLEAVRTQ